MKYQPAWGNIFSGISFLSAIWFIRDIDRASRNNEWPHQHRNTIVVVYLFIYSFFSKQNFFKKNQKLEESLKINKLPKSHNVLKVNLKTNKQILKIKKNLLLTMDQEGNTSSSKTMQ